MTLKSIDSWSVQRSVVFFSPFFRKEAALGTAANRFHWIINFWRENVAFTFKILQLFNMDMGKVS